MQPATPSDAGALLDSFSSVGAWMLLEISRLMGFLLDEPILLLAMSLFFVGAIIALFIHVLHSV